jgi:uncharacterized coiled-coil protein SlyX
MSKLKYLEQRIKDLEALVKTQAELIKTMKSAQPEQNQITIRTFPQQLNGQYKCYDGCVYPSPWMSITPPHCMKCGQQAYSTSITCEIKDGVGHFNTSGYVGVTK